MGGTEPIATSSKTSFVEALREKMPSWARRFDPRWVLGIPIALLIVICCCGGLTLGSLTNGDDSSDDTRRDSSSAGRHSDGASADATAEPGEGSKAPASPDATHKEPGGTPGDAKRPAHTQLTVPSVVGKNAAVAK
ncbi:MAG: hypothetical protein ACRDTD_23915, partial [Pseudonocardiaceae bacterium]